MHATLKQDTATDAATIGGQFAATQMRRVEIPDAQLCGVEPSEIEALATLTPLLTWVTRGVIGEAPRLHAAASLMAAAVFLAGGGNDPERSLAWAAELGTVLGGFAIGLTHREYAAEGDSHAHGVSLVAQYAAVNEHGSDLAGLEPRPAHSAWPPPLEVPGSIQAQRPTVEALASIIAWVHSEVGRGQGAPYEVGLLTGRVVAAVACGEKSIAREGRSDAIAQFAARLAVWDARSDAGPLL